MQTQELQQLIKTAYNKVFPLSSIWFKKHALDSGFAGTATLGANSSEYPNGIVQNDPLTLSMHYWPEENKIEIKASFIIKPTETHLYCSNYKMRKQNIKAAKFNEQTFVEYFELLKFEMLKQRSNWHPEVEVLMGSKVYAS